MRSRRILFLLALAGPAASPLAAHAAGDAAKGKAVFNRCAICHTTKKGGPNGIGPNLFGVVGRKSASVKGFNYSAAMKKSGIIWNDEKLAAYIAHPAQLVPGNRMAFAGVTNRQQTDDLIAFLKTLK